MPERILSPFNEYDVRVMLSWALPRPFRISLCQTEAGEEYYALEPTFHWREVDALLGDLHVIRLGKRLLAISSDRELASGPTMADALNALARRLPDGPRLQDASPRPVGPRGSLGQAKPRRTDEQRPAFGASAQTGRHSDERLVPVGRGQPMDLPVGDWRRRVPSYQLGQLQVPASQAVPSDEVREAQRAKSRALAQRRRDARLNAGDKDKQ